MTINIVTDIIIDMAIDIIISSTQTLIFFIDPNIFLKINPHLLISKVEVEKWERKIKRHILVPTLLSILR